MTDRADFHTLYETAVSLNNMAVTLQDNRRYLLAHQTLKDAMLCMQLILRPDQYQVWPSKNEMTLKVNIATERIRLAEIRTCQVEGGSDQPQTTQDKCVPLVAPIPIDYDRLDRTGVDVNSAIIVFNFGLTYLGLALPNCAKNRQVLHEAAVELFYLSYSILVKLSVETEQLDFCEYVLILSMKMLRQTIVVDVTIGRDVSQLSNLLRNAEDSFAVLHRIGQATVAAAA